MKFHRLLLLLFGLTVFAGTAMAAPESATPPEEPAGPPPPPPADPASAVRACGASSPI